MLTKAEKDKWVAALRSGNYQQTQGALRIDDRYCCLGVLCDILDPDGWIKNDDFQGRYYSHHHQGTYSSKLLNSRMDRHTLKGLVDLNDNNDSTFDEIADYIEKNVPCKERAR